MQLMRLIVKGDRSRGVKVSLVMKKNRWVTFPNKFVKTLKTEFSRMFTPTPNQLYYLHLLEFIKLSLNADLPRAVHKSVLRVQVSPTLTSWVWDLLMEKSKLKFHATLTRQIPLLFATHPNLQLMTHLCLCLVSVHFLLRLMELTSQTVRSTSRFTQTKSICKLWILSADLSKEGHK